MALLEPFGPRQMSGTQPEAARGERRRTKLFMENGTSQKTYTTKNHKGTTPAIALYTAALDSPLTVTLDAPASGSAKVQYATVDRQGESGNRIPRSDEWVDAGASIPATATHWRLLVETEANDGESWNVTLSNDVLEFDQNSPHVYNERLYGETYEPETLDPDVDITAVSEQGGEKVLLRQSGSLNWTTTGLVKGDRIFIGKANFTDNGANVHQGMYIVVQVVDANDLEVSYLQDPDAQVGVQEPASVSLYQKAS